MRRGRAAKVGLSTADSASHRPRVASGTRYLPCESTSPATISGGGGGGRKKERKLAVAG